MEIPCEAKKRSPKEIEAAAMEIEAAEMEIEMKKRGAPFIYGLVGPFLRKFAFEDREHVPTSEYYDSSGSDSDGDDRPVWVKFRHPNAHEVVKRFLQQVRESNGYDVDCVPPPNFCSPFLPITPDTKDELMRSSLMRAVHFAVGKINAETGKNYEFVKVEKSVFTLNSSFLLTLTVKDCVDSSLETLRAMVFEPYSHKGEYALLEWMYKPLPATATEKPRKAMDPEKTKAKVCESTDLGSLNREILEKIFSFLDDKSATNLSVTCKSCLSARPSSKKPCV
ncbi:hypothetical protein C2S53_007192 [Perilla frutescens var. hirtella]|uniref:F-box domain-containing protein n=1 Tax=Perilla frutescens var. hirtella TaxID=608512 RepID=A0AAD4J2G3_PERFH|nr:hypothetical protein C2S53_007192 [Perilla frutescens var. hirtella]